MAKKKIKVPAEWVDGKIVMGAPPAKLLRGFGHERFRHSQLDFNVKYQFYIWYFNKMDESHREIITIKKSRVSCISSEGAHLLKKHLNFFKEKFLEEKAALASLKKDLKQKCQKEKAGVSHKKDMELAWKETIKSASAKAGVSIKELNQKLEKLSTLAKGEDIALAVRMVTDFDDSWLFEILLAGSTIDKDGYLVPGKSLKIFKEYAQFFGVLALTHAPENTNLHPSLNKNKLQYFKFTSDSPVFELFNIIATEILPKIPHLKITGDLDLDRLNSLSDAAVKALSRHEGDLFLSGLTSLSDAAAEALSKHKGYLDLDGLNSLTDAAAKALSKHEGDLSLRGLTILSDAAAEALSKYKGSYLVLESLTSLSNAAADALCKFKGKNLWLNGLKNLSDAAAEALSKHKGDLHLDALKSLTDAAAKALSKHKGDLSGDLFLNGLTSLSDTAAEALSKHEGNLYLNGLKSLSDAAAVSFCKHESLSKYKGYLSLNGLTSLSDAAAKALVQKPGGFNKLNVPFSFRNQIRKHRKKQTKVVK